MLSSSASQPTATYPLEVSFSKFHVTRPNRAGYNKIYEIRRSKSFFFELVDQFSDTNHCRLNIHTNDYHMNTKPINYNSTSLIPNHKYQISIMLNHFFKHQSVIPKRVQHKYFPLIRTKLLERITIIKSRASQNRDRNHSTKTFFNFSYKRYHFYFGIYIPCSSIVNSVHQPGVIGLCKVPSPIVLSHYRRACVSHQHKLERFANIQPHNSNTAISNLPLTHRHAHLIHQRWKSKETKTVYSNRLGISYTVRYLNDKHKRRDWEGSQCMYYKRLENFTVMNSSQGTRTKQQSRFDRACRRIFNKDKSFRTDTVYHQRLCAIKFHFLIDKKHYCQRPLQHLKHRWRNGLMIYRPYPHPNPPIDQGYLDYTISYSSGQLRTYLEKKQRLPYQPLDFTALDNELHFLESRQIARLKLANYQPYVSTTTGTSPPSGARSIDTSDWEEEDDVLPSVIEEKAAPSIFSQLKRTKTAHDLNPPIKRTGDLFSSAGSTSSQKKSKS